jgi:hypothetical protein
MPKVWFEDTHADLRKKCKVPEGLELKTKNVLLSEMINEMQDSGLFDCKYVGVDSAFGSDSKFLDAVPEGLVYFADIRSCLHLFDRRPEIILPAYSGRGRPPVPGPSFKSKPASEIAADPSIPWNDVVLDMGSKGPIMSKDKCIKVVEVRDGLPAKDVWLYVRQLEDGSMKYSLCNESMDATLEQVRTPALMRWSIEQCFRECKTNLGMDHYEVRSWIGWKRHMLFTFIAHLFFSKLRRKYSIVVDTPLGPAPFIKKPVAMDDYRKAVHERRQDQPISHPSISACPIGPQQVLTVGMLQAIIQPFMLRVGKALDIANHLMREASWSYISHSKAKLTDLVPANGTG